MPRHARTILDIVAAVTDESGSEYVPPPEWVAVFDNDDRLWCEKPVNGGGKLAVYR